MKNPFSKSRVLRWYRNLQSRREQRRRHREALRTLQLWSWLEKLFESGQLSFDYENHRLFITQTMASLMMAHGADGWVQAVHNIYEYAHWMQTRHAWEDFMQKEELKAVREALAGLSPDPSPEGKGGAAPPNPNSPRPFRGGVGGEADPITLADIDRIKHTRRQEIALGDMEPPKAEPFEFFIIPLSTAAKVEPIAVGHYDPTTGQMEVATWDEVKPLLKAAE